MAGEDLRELGDIPFDIRIQFRAEHDGDLVPQEIPVEVGVGEGDAIRRDQQLGILEIRRRGVMEPELDWPVQQLGFGLKRRFAVAGPGIPRDAPACGAGAGGMCIRAGECRIRWPGGLVLGFAGWSPGRIRNAVDLLGACCEE
jgi:hypothetical protein